MATPKDIVEPFYTQCLTVNSSTDVSATMGRLLADDFESTNMIDSKSKAQLTGQVQHFWNSIPDLKWEIQEMLQDGNKVIVRSIASGSPRGDFMGLKLDGSKSFRIMTIDIHTVEGNQVRQVHHLEDWVSAIKQLQG